jgi:uncharacterized Fe-S radical SAM superfamily protein PflX
MVTFKPVTGPCLRAVNWNNRYLYAGHEIQRFSDSPPLFPCAQLLASQLGGDLQSDENGLAYRGLLVRHLLLPNGLAGTEKVLEFMAREISINT